MANSIHDREYKKFREKPNGEVTVGVEIDDDKPVNVESAGVDWDSIETTFPSSTTELFTYKKSTTILQTVLVTYESASKKTVIKVEKTRY